MMMRVNNPQLIDLLHTNMLFQSNNVESSKFLEARTTRPFPLRSLSLAIYTTHSCASARRDHPVKGISPAGQGGLVPSYAGPQAAYCQQFGDSTTRRVKGYLNNFIIRLITYLLITRLLSVQGIISFYSNIILYQDNC